MNVNIVILILGFCFCGCYANPRRHFCVQDSDILSPLHIGLDDARVQERLEDPDQLLLEKKFASLRQIMTGGGSKTGPRYRKSYLNYQKPSDEPSEYTGDSFKEESMLRPHLELFEVPKRSSKNFTIILKTGELAPSSVRPVSGKRRYLSTALAKTGNKEESEMKIGFAFPTIIGPGRSHFRPDIQLLREDASDPNLSVDATYKDFEYEL